MSEEAKVSECEAEFSNYTGTCTLSAVQSTLINSSSTGPILKKLFASSDFVVQIEQLITDRFDEAYKQSINFVLNKLKIDIYKPLATDKNLYTELYVFTRNLIRPFFESMKERHSSCELFFDDLWERQQKKMFAPSEQSDRDPKKLLSLNDISRTFYIILVYLINPDLRYTFNNNVFIKSAEFGVLRLQSMDGPDAHLIAMFKCNGKEFVDYAQALKNSSDYEKNILEFKWTVFLSKLRNVGLFTEYFIEGDIRLLKFYDGVNSLVSISGKEYPIPSYNLTYALPNGNFLFLLNNIFEEFKIEDDDVLHKYFCLGMLYFSPNNVVKRAFLVRGSGRNRTKRNRKNRKATRRLKRRQ